MTFFLKKKKCKSIYATKEFKQHICRLMTNISKCLCSLIKQININTISEVSFMVIFKQTIPERQSGNGAMK